MGAGGLVILDDTNCIVDLCVYFEWFAEDESCGRCTTCFAGTRRMLEILRRISEGRGRLADLELMKLLGRIAQNANCFHGQGAPTAHRVDVPLLRGRADGARRAQALPGQGLRAASSATRSCTSRDRLPPAEAICPTNAVVKDNGQLLASTSEVRQVRRLPRASAVRDRRGRRVRARLTSWDWRITSQVPCYTVVCVV